MDTGATPRESTASAASVTLERAEQSLDVEGAVADAERVYARQPYRYRFEQHEEPDWRRLPGFASVTRSDWDNPTWQRRNSVRSVGALAEVFGRFLAPELARSIERDQAERATMPLSVPPQMINTMDEQRLWTDPIRRYMLPAVDDRDVEWPTHPVAQRDSLHEAEMFAVDGLIHRYPTKVLIELTATCPQYCGHCTRMDLVGHDVPQVEKLRLRNNRKTRHDAALEYMRRVPWVRDVVVSGGDIADVPIKYLEAFLSSLFEIENIRSVRLATKALIGVPQYFLEPNVLAAFERIARKAEREDVSLAMHVHINHAQSVTPTVSAASRALQEVGIHHVRNQGVLLRGVNDSFEDLLDLCFALLDKAHIQPYYFYMCDMIPNSEHWRIPLASAQRLQDDLTGYLPGFATPRIVCDVPGVGKRLVHQVAEYDRITGVSSWRKNYVTAIDADSAAAGVDSYYHYYDPVPSLPVEGQAYWRTFGSGNGVERSAHPAP
jgi:lysine 2,3-aminomutase